MRLGEDFKLRISLELYLKRLIVGGIEKYTRLDVCSVMKDWTQDIILNLR